MTIIKAVTALTEKRSDTPARGSPVTDSDESLAAWERHPGERTLVDLTRVRWLLAWKSA